MFNRPIMAVSPTVKPPTTDEELKSFFSEDNFFGKGYSLTQRQQHLRQFMNEIVVFEFHHNSKVLRFTCVRHLLIDCPCPDGTTCSCENSLLLTFGPAKYHVSESKEDHEGLRSDEVPYKSVISLISQSQHYLGTTPPWYTFVYNT